MNACNRCAGKHVSTNRLAASLRNPIKDTDGDSHHCPDGYLRGMPGGLYRTLLVTNTEVGRCRRYCRTIHTTAIVVARCWLTIDWRFVGVPVIAVTVSSRPRSRAQQLASHQQSRQRQVRHRNSPNRRHNRRHSSGHHSRRHSGGRHNRRDMHSRATPVQRRPREHR